MKRKPTAQFGPHSLTFFRSKQPFRFRPRNFDPETRTLRKHTNADEVEDTVEKAVEGLAEKIIAEDEERRKQELVRGCVSYP